jgi:hypothetical protein
MLVPLFIAEKSTKQTTSAFLLGSKLFNSNTLSTAKYLFGIRQLMPKKFIDEQNCFDTIRKELSNG